MINAAAALPEILLVLFAMAALLFAVFGGKDEAAPSVLWASAAALAAAALFVGAGGRGTREAFHGAFVDDGYARFAKVTILLSAAAILVIGRRHMERLGILKFEYPILITLAAVGMMMMVSAGDLMALYMGLELQSLALYVVASIDRDSTRSTEAGLKYFVLGALSSGLLLYGASLVYGYAGTTLFSGILRAAGDGASIGLVFGLVFISVGLAFKVSAAPFHMWTPDVYEGAPTPVTAFFATAPKVAAMVLFGRVLWDAFGGVSGDWTQIVAFLSVVSMFLGAVAAIGQRDIKRLMAYSSISHMGFALIGLAAGTEEGARAMLIYMVVYVVMNIGVFAFILSMEREGEPVTDIGALNNYSKGEPLKGLALLVLMFSLAGVPPFVGFFAKLYVLSAAVGAGMAWLALAGAVASVIAAYYYLRIVYFMYFGEEGAPLDRTMTPANWIALLACAGAMAAGVVNLFGIEALAASAAAALVD